MIKIFAKQLNLNKNKNGHFLYFATTTHCNFKFWKIYPPFYTHTVCLPFYSEKVVQNSAAWRRTVARVFVDWFSCTMARNHFLPSQYTVRKVLADFAVCDVWRNSKALLLSKVLSNRGKCSKILSHGAKQQRHQLNFLTVYYHDVYVQYCTVVCNPF